MLTETATGGAVVLRGFCKAYGFPRKGRPACTDVDFSAAPGSITGILGPNGAGKSTLLRAICGIHYATKGTVTVCGTTDAMRIRTLTAFVPEVPELDGSLTVAETLAEEALLHGVPAQERPAAIKDAVAATELSAVLGQKVSSLSKGYRQRTSLAKALAARPQVLVLDEFSAGLDPAQTVRIRQVLSETARTCTVILSTHRIPEAEELCRTLYVLHRGTVAAQGTPAEICAATGQETLERAFLALTEG